MISTGIDLLDSRLGGLLAGRYYLVSGQAGAGKTSMALHFLGAGLETGETCAILTQEDPEDLMAQAEYLGHDFRSAAEKEQLVVLQFRLDFAHNLTRLTDPARLREELVSLLGDTRPSRFVIDSISPFVDTGGAAREMIAALAHLLDHVEATTYLTVPGDFPETQFWVLLDRIRSGAAGIFHVRVEEGEMRELSIRKLRQAAVSTEPMRFSIRPGLGVVAARENVRRLESLSPESRERVVLLNLGSEPVHEEFRAGLDEAYELHTYETMEGSFGELSRGEFGVLVLAMDSRQPGPAIGLARELRRSGSGVPILFLAPNRDLRSSTRAKGLRAGGDDFLTDELSVQEFLERVEMARVRGFRGPGDPQVLENLLMQPTDEDGRAVPVEETEVRRVVRHVVSRAGHPFFALVFLRTPDYLPDTWRILCDDLRVREGDLVGRTPDGRLILYLHDVSRRDVRDLLARLVEVHPELAALQEVVVYSYPADRSDVEAWIAREEVLQGAEAE